MNEDRPRPVAAVSATFGDPQDVEQAKRLLREAGVPEEQIVSSPPLTSDGIAAEAPGQSYVNQDEPTSQETGRASYLENESVRSASCVLSVRAASGEELARAAALLRRAGARRVWDAPT